MSVKIHINRMTHNINLLLKPHTMKKLFFVCLNPKRVQQLPIGTLIKQSAGILHCNNAIEANQIAFEVNGFVLHVTFSLN